jgi:hypothetical protein
MKAKILVAVIFGLYFANLCAKSPVCLSEEDSTSGLSFSFNADVVSRYIWRGLPSNLSANLQPYASIEYKNFAFGAWGSYAVNSAYSEVDLYFSYNAGPVSFTINDYYNEDEADLAANDYFNFSNTDTSCSPHALEGAITFNGSENMPLSITAATFFYGNDVDSTNSNYYSTYLELAYTTTLNDNDIKFFAGGTIGEGYYADKAAFVNIGFTASRDIKFSDSFSLPVTTSLIINPNAKDIFFVFGLTF